MVRKIERDFVAADLATVEGIIAQLGDGNAATRLSFESRRDELREELAALEAAPDHTMASAALFFGGDPVVASEGVESAFAGHAVASFQDIVSKLAAAKQTPLGERGPVRGTGSTTMHVTGVVHGSFGFELRELGDPGLFDSMLKESVEEAVRVMSAFDTDQDDVLEQSIEDIDSRALQTVEGFFQLMNSNGASMRIVAGNVDKTFDRATITRVAERVRVTTIKDQQVVLRGQLAGILPEHRTYEYRTSDHGVLFGKLDPSLRKEDIPQLNKQWLDQDSAATFNLREVTRPNRPPHLAYFLVSIRAQNDQNA